MNAVLSWLCCKRRKHDDLRNKGTEEGKVSATKPADTGQGGCQPTDGQPQVGKREKGEKKEPPWLMKYFQTATYYPGQFESDNEEEEEDDEDDSYKGGEVELPDDEKVDNVDEIFEFLFHESTFRFPHEDYDQVTEARRPAKRKMRERKQENRDIEIEEFSISEYYNNGKRNEIDCDHRRRWRGRCHETTRREKDMIFDSVAARRDTCTAMRDTCTKMGGIDREIDTMFDHCNASEYRPTPMLSLEIVQGNDAPGYWFD